MKRMMLCIAVVAFGTLLAGTANAQESVPSPTPTTYNLEWTHDGADTDGYNLYTDGSRTDLGAVPRRPDGTYRVAFPALTPGPHTLEVSAYNLAGESGKAVLLVRVIVIPTTPTNFRIVVLP